MLAKWAAKGRSFKLKLILTVHNDGGFIFKKVSNDLFFNFEVCRL